MIFNIPFAGGLKFDVSKLGEDGGKKNIPGTSLTCTYELIDSVKET